MSAVRSPSRALWILTAVIAAGLLVAAFAPGAGARLPVIVVQVGFVLLHGAHRYGRRAIGVFAGAGLIISNILENLSIRTGFPFGHYHYTGGGKIFAVPWFIGPAYLATGYLAWIVATVLLGDVRRGSPWLTTIGTPVVGAFTMTAWDLAFDPTTSTVDRAWIWEHGGGFFGVPLVNFLGWTLTVYLFLQVFALYLRHRGPATWPGRITAGDLQAVLLYAATTVSYFVTFFTAAHTTVTDATGATWRTADIYETSVLLTIYGMLFMTLLALLRIAHRPRLTTRPADQRARSAACGSPGTTP
ncbi:carotenoid biosynthesis protein [Amycolatopsis sp.]|uniref:carotenoid biosynthesis protein n=1 Tax=Amycolatopsis sp. TaxID=37632 RepID=UPI002C6FA85C|nr:carotenoid biosynthesis protein [Amycolatopsis sp.]HVV08267.1 carotenoid biosynthesis protein [Amycolatopsis sp.]